MIWSFAIDVIEAAWALFISMAPYLLLGFLAAGLLHGFVPLSFLTRHLGGEGPLAVIKAAILGVPLPLCSCGVLPVAASLRSSGVGKAPTAAFLITTPVTGVDSLVATWGILGGVFTLARITASVVIGTLVGFATRIFRSSEGGDHVSADAAPSPQQIQGTTLEKLLISLRYGLLDLPGEIAGPLLIGLLFGGLIYVLVPEDLLGAHVSTGFFGILIALGVAVPMYVCATGSLPIAAAMIMKGFSPGAALVFLIAGPATNTVALATVRKLLGTKVLIVYLTGIILGAMGFGIVFDLLWSGPSTHLAESHIHQMETSDTLFQTAGGLLVVLLSLAWAKIPFIRLWNRIRASSKPKSPIKTIRLVVPAMNCSNCERRVVTALHEVEGVHEVQVDLDAKTVTVSMESNVPTTRLKQALSKAGYDLSP